MRTLIMLVVVSLLGGCGHYQNINPLPGTRKPPQEKAFSSKYKSRVRLNTGMPATSLATPQLQVDGQ